MTLIMSVTTTTTAMMVVMTETVLMVIMKTAETDEGRASFPRTQLLPPQLSANRQPIPLIAIKGE